MWGNAMRFYRIANGRLSLDIFDEPDFDVARNVSRAIMKAFQGRQQQPLIDVDGSSWLDIDLEGGACVTVHVQQYMGIDVYARDEQSDGVIYDIANYLSAHLVELGLQQE